MELRHLEQIAAICKAGSFSAASDRLGISQPTLSKSIARLEEKLGVKLFERATGRAQPTVYGAYIADQGQALLQRVSAIDDELEKMVRGEAGTLRIAVGPATRVKPLPAIVRRLAADLPDLRMAIRYASPAVMMRGLRMGRFDLALCHREVAKTQNDFIRVKLFEDQYVAVVSPGHPGLAQAPLDPAGLLRYPLASAGITPDFRAWVGSVEAVLAINLEFIISDDYDVLKARPQDSHSIARGPRFVFERELAAGSLVELPLTCSFSYECWMLTTAVHWRSPVLKTVARIAKEVSRGAAQIYLHPHTNFDGI
jgi:DNA-binding transcriptional LysR family regulator